MESQIWCLPCSVALLGVGSEEDQWPLSAVLSQRKLAPNSCPDARRFSSSPYATGAFKLLPQCWSSVGMSLRKSICRPLREIAWKYSSFFYQLNLHFSKTKPRVPMALGFVSTAKSHGDLSYKHWKEPWVEGPVAGLGSSLLRYPS